MKVKEEQHNARDNSLELFTFQAWQQPKDTAMPERGGRHLHVHEW